METTKDQSESSNIDAAIQALNAQNEATTTLVAALAQLVEAIAHRDVAPELHPACVKELQGRCPRWFYRAWSDKSQENSDFGRDLRARDPTWVLDSYKAVALHFAEVHSDEYNPKKTALVSGTTDVIRALKKVYVDWATADFKTRDPAKIFITIFHTSEYYMASELLKYLREAGLWNHLSLDARQRLDSTRCKFLHDSEALFLHRIRSEDIKLQDSFEELNERCIWSYVPELEERVGDRRIWPKLIREKSMKIAAFYRQKRRSVSRTYTPS